MGTQEISHFAIVIGIQDAFIKDDKHFAATPFHEIIRISLSFR